MAGKLWESGWGVISDVSLVNYLSLFQRVYLQPVICTLGRISEVIYVPVR